MERILFGDNQFFGINHMSEEKARRQAMQFAEPEAGHARKQVMLEVVVESPGRNQPQLPERRQHGAPSGGPGLTV